MRFGNYLLLDRLNVGGMAEVFRAKVTSLEGVERLVAIKRILPHLARDPEFTNMFIDEARIAVTLHHANIAQVYELGRVGESLFIAMEYVHGRDIRSLINRSRHVKRRLSIPLVVHVVSKVCEGLDYAHRRKDMSQRDLNIVHRDISPQNIIVSYEGEVKIIDFGIAKAASKRSHTEAGILKGKFGYMAPEQVMGEAIDRRADIFCAGILLYEMLTSERLFVGSNELSTLQKIRHVEILPPTYHNRNIPEALEKIIMRALAQHVEDRYQFASELQEALQRFLIEHQQELFNTRHLRQTMHDFFNEEIRLDQERLEALMLYNNEPKEAISSSQQRTSHDIQSPHQTQEDQYPQNTPLPPNPRSWSQDQASPAGYATQQSPAAPDYAYQAQPQYQTTAPAPKPAGAPLTEAGPTIAERTTPPPPPARTKPAAPSPQPTSSSNNPNYTAVIAVGDRQRRRSSNTWLWSMIGGVFVALLGVMLYLLFLVPPPNPTAPLPNPNPFPRPPAPSTEVAIDLTSEPGSASIFLDEKRLGLTPNRVTLKKRNEGYRLEVRKDGYQTFQRVIRVRHGASKPVPLHIKLQAIPAAAYLTVKPRSRGRFRIFLDGKDLKRSKLERYTVPSGEHTLLFVKRKRRWTLRVQLKPGEHKTLRPSYR